MGAVSSISLIDIRSLFLPLLKRLRPAIAVGGGKGGEGGGEKGKEKGKRRGREIKYVAFQRVLPFRTGGGRRLVFKSRRVKREKEKRKGKRKGKREKKPETPPFVLEPSKWHIVVQSKPLLS